MSSFHDQFSPDPDPEMADIRRVWITDKPLLRDAVVTYAPPYPDYPEMEPDEVSCDPSCPSARDAGDTIEVTMHANKNGFGDYQERAWSFVVENAAEIEAALRRKLFAQHLKDQKRFLEDDLPDYEEAQSYWEQIKDRIDWSDPSAVDHLYKLVGIGLLDDGLDECGFTSFEFQTGWDHDHGKSILMHNSHVLIAGGMSEYTYFESGLTETIKAVQAYDLDDGDLSLLDG